MVEKKRVVLLLAAILSLAALASFLLIRNDRISPPGAAVAKEQLLEDLEQINGDELSVEFIEVHNDEEVQGDLIQMIAHKPRNVRLPVEVRGAMRIWLYAEQRRLPFQLQGVRVYCDNAWTFDKAVSVVVTKTEFQQLSQSITAGSDEERLERLTNAWMEQHRYESPFAD